jgi:cytochrome c oxidase cbb3-type subunit 3
MAANEDTGHDYDGIRELDNRLPNWWLATLGITVAFGYGYWIFMHVLSGPSQLAAWHAEEAAVAQKAAASGPVTDQLLTGLAHSEEVKQKAEVIFGQVCAVCHGAKGEGKLGPNLTDAYWIHGPRPTDIFKTISKGVTTKGMPAWEPQLGAEKTRWLAAYVSTLRGKNLPGKAPEGARAE